MKIAITAASSAVPEIELEEGADRLRAEGFDVRVDPRCLARHFTYAGTDDQRAMSLWEAAVSDAQVVWMARGGYGAARLLPMLDELTKQHGPPARKMLVGYSDVTVLHEYVRRRWGWTTLHAPMPATANFGKYDPAQWEALMWMVRGQRPDDEVWGRVSWMTEAVEVEGELVGGNLSLWASLVGTPYAPTPARGRILFLEDIGERFYRIDRMVTQIRQAGLIDGALAIVLGDFTDCDDDAIKKVKQRGGGTRPLRLAIAKEEALREIFGGLGVPVATGLPVGHGPGFAPLLLGGIYRVSREGEVEMRRDS